MKEIEERLRIACEGDRRIGTPTCGTYAATGEQYHEILVSHYPDEESAFKGALAAFERYAWNAQQRLAVLACPCNRSKGALLPLQYARKIGLIL